MTVKPVELLAPAGSSDAYKAAAAAGADAVYLGAKGFNARQQAENFSLQELAATIEDAHVRGIKVYFVLNTLVSESEFQKAFDFASFVYQEGIDGIIVQDLGLAGLLKKEMPKLTIHASTQMTIHNTDGVKEIQSLGIDRVVLSRELNLTEIKNIIKNTGVEAEVFIHGALCISRSGQCLLSSFIGGRSGNRGRCAQPCRLPWSLEGKHVVKGHLLSPKDLMTLELLPQIVDTGVSALKIEGRMKSPEYVAAVVMIYRKYLDMAIRSPRDYKVRPEDIHLLMQIFNRGGFSTGYLRKGNLDRLMCTEHPKHWGIPVGSVCKQKEKKMQVSSFQKNRMMIPIQFQETVHMGDGLEIWDSDNNDPSAIVSVMMDNNWHVKKANAGDILMVGNFKSGANPGSPVYKTYEKSLMEHMSRMIEKHIPRVSLLGTFRLFDGEKPVLDITDPNGNRVSVQGAEAAKEALGKPVTSDRIRDQLSKTGDTPYFFERITVHTDSHSYIPVSELNRMRREAIQNISEMRRTASKRPISTRNEIIDEHFPGNAKKLSNHQGISLLFYSIPENMNWEGLDAKRVYLPVTGLNYLEEVKRQGMKGYVWSPAVMHDSQVDRFIERITPYLNCIDGILAGNLGTLHRFREAFPPTPIAIDFPMNVYNSWTIDVLEKYEPTSIMLSPELNLQAIREIISFKIPLETLVYGEIPVMTLEYCPGKNNGDCNKKCDKCQYRQGYLTDRVGKKFLYRTDPDLRRTTLFNSSRLMLEDVQELKETNIDILRLNILTETTEEIHALCRFYGRQWTGRHMNQDQAEVEQLKTIKRRSLTKGHYFRGAD